MRHGHQGPSRQPATILANAAYQTVTGTTGADYIKVQAYGDTINGDGGADVFEVDNTTLGWYNAMSDANGAGKIVANFASGNGVSTIDLNGKTGVIRRSPRRQLLPAILAFNAANDMSKPFAFAELSFMQALVARRPFISIFGCCHKSHC